MVFVSPSLIFFFTNWVSNDGDRRRHMSNIVAIWETCQTYAMKNGLNQEGNPLLSCLFKIGWVPAAEILHNYTLY